MLVGVDVGASHTEAAIGIDAAANDIGQLAISLASHFKDDSPIDVAFSGGVLSLDSPVRTILRAFLAGRIPHIRVVGGAVDPVLGALSMADRLASC